MNTLVQCSISSAMEEDERIVLISCLSSSPTSHSLLQGTVSWVGGRGGGGLEMRLPTRIVRELLMSHLLVCVFTSALFSTSTSMHSKCPLAAARDNIGRLSPSRAVTSAPCVASKQRGHSHSSAICHGVHHLCHESTTFYQLLRFHNEVIL